MTPPAIKTTGYIVSTFSVLMLGAAALPGAAKAGLIPILALGMAASVAGMALRWWSYEVENRQARRRAPTGLEV